jgi:hypothetical protein
VVGRDYDEVLSILFLRPLNLPSWRD